MPVILILLVLFDGLATWLGVGYAGHKEANLLVATMIAHLGLGLTLTGITLFKVVATLFLAQVTHLRLARIGMCLAILVYLLASVLPWSVKLLIC